MRNERNRRMAFRRKEKLAVSRVTIKETRCISGARATFNTFSALSRFSLTFPV